MRKQETGDIAETLAEAESMQHKTQSTRGTDREAVVVMPAGSGVCQGLSWGTACGVHGESTAFVAFCTLKVSYK